MTALVPPEGQAREVDRVVTSALGYAARGWPVLPLHSITSGGACTCGSLDCTGPGKHPRTPNGLKDASADPAAIRSWWARWPQANVGIVTGTPSGLVVLDVDPRHGGDESLDELEYRFRKLPETVEVLTGGGGRHFYFAHPGDTLVRNATTVGGLPGLDLRGDGGYVVAPPSTHVSGRRYEWERSSDPEELALAPFPATMLQGLSNPTWGARQRGAGPDDAARIPEGERNVTLTSLAGTMRRRGMTEDEIGAALLVANAARCEPRLAEDEVRRIAASISHKEPGPQRESQATQLVRLAEDTALWHAPNGEAYATVPVVRETITHFETHAVKSTGMRRWLQHRYFLAQRRAASAQAVQDALGVLEGKARFEGAEHLVSVRVAEGADGSIYVHLADTEWSVVRIAPIGWVVLSSDEVPTEIRFRRPSGMLALPRPVPGGDLRELRRFANLPDDDQLVQS